MYSIKSPFKAVDDSDFHLLNKNGELDVVKLEPLSKKAIPTLNSGCDIKTNIKCHAQDCKCFQCDLGSKQASSKYDLSKGVNVEQEAPKIGKIIPETTLYLYPKFVSTQLSNINEATNKTGALKTYSRLRKNHVEPGLIRLMKTEGSCSAAIKIEPELDIEDKEPQPTRKIIKDNLEKRVPMVEHVIIGNKSVKPVQKVINPTVLSTDSGANVTNLSAISNILELAKKTVKCNVCGMIFPKSDNQVSTLGKHFLEHKTSVVNVVKKYNEDTSKTQRKKLETCDDSKRPKRPVILNTLLKKIQKPVTLIPVVKTYLSPVEKKKNESSRIAVSNLPTILKHRKFQNTAENTHVVIGSTLIKPIKHAKTIKSVDEESNPASGSVCTSDSKGSDDADDDIEIVEDRPELIVIDDNDELEQLNENEQKSI